MKYWIDLFLNSAILFISTLAAYFIAPIIISLLPDDFKSENLRFIIAAAIYLSIVFLLIVLRSVPMVRAIIDPKSKFIGQYITIHGSEDGQTQYIGIFEIIYSIRKQDLTIKGTTYDKNTGKIIGGWTSRFCKFDVDKREVLYVYTGYGEDSHKSRSPITKNIYGLSTLIFGDEMYSNGSGEFQDLSETALYRHIKVFRITSKLLSEVLGTRARSLSSADDIINFAENCSYIKSSKAAS